MVHAIQNQRLIARKKIEKSKFRDKLIPSLIIGFKLVITQLFFIWLIITFMD